MLLALLSCAGKAGAQTVAVKSDLLTGGMLASPNLGVELKLSERFTPVSYTQLDVYKRQESSSESGQLSAMACFKGSI